MKRRERRNWEIKMRREERQRGWKGRWRWTEWVGFYQTEEPNGSRWDFYEKKCVCDSPYAFRFRGSDFSVAFVFLQQWHAGQCLRAGEAECSADWAEGEVVEEVPPSLLRQVPHSFLDPLQVNESRQKIVHQEKDRCSFGGKRPCWCRGYFGDSPLHR